MDIPHDNQPHLSLRLASPLLENKDCVFLSVHGVLILQVDDYWMLVSFTPVSAIMCPAGFWGFSNKEWIGPGPPEGHFLMHESLNKGTGSLSLHNKSPQTMDLKEHIYFSRSLCVLGVLTRLGKGPHPSSHGRWQHPVSCRRRDWGPHALLWQLMCLPVSLRPPRERVS